MEPIVVTVNPAHVSFVLGCITGQIPLILLMAGSWRQHKALIAEQEKQRKQNEHKNTNTQRLQ